MSSRQEQKEQRRQERLAAEAAEAERKTRQQRLLYVGGALVAVLAIAAVIAAIVASGGGDSTTKDPTTGKDITPKPPVAGAAIPTAVDTNLQSAAKAAGCTVKTFESEGRSHDPNPSAWKYKTNPPTSGTHNPVPAQDGVYPFGTAPDVGSTVHALEHGRIDIQYSPKLTRQQFGQLQTLMAEEDQGYHQLMFKNQTNMPATVAATAWTQQLTCPTFTPKVFDALRDFKSRYTDQAPETVP